MPNLFVVGTERSLADLADSVLLKRTAAATRATALDAIRAANPGLDLDRIDPGTVVVLPDVKGLRRVSAGEPVHDAAADLVTRVKEGIGGLLAAAEVAEEQRRTERHEAEDVVRDPVVKSLASQVPELAANLKSLRRSWEVEDAEAERAMVSLRQAADGWVSDLETLSRLHL